MIEKRTEKSKQRIKVILNWNFWLPWAGFTRPERPSRNWLFQGKVAKSGTHYHSQLRFLVFALGILFEPRNMFCLLFKNLGYLIICQKKKIKKIKKIKKNLISN